MERADNVTHKHGNSPTKADRSDVQRSIIKKKAPRTTKSGQAKDRKY